MKTRYFVCGTGSQAPYGIGETIKSFSATPAGLKKAAKFALRFGHSPAAVHDADGDKIDLDLREIAGGLGKLKI